MKLIIGSAIKVSKCDTVDFVSLQEVIFNSNLATTFSCIVGFALAHGLHLKKEHKQSAEGTQENCHILGQNPASGPKI